VICLDTNVVIGCMSGRPPALAERLERTLLREDCVLSTIVLFELRYGIAKSARARENKERLATFLELPIAILPFQPDDADEAGDIRAALERAGTPTEQRLRQTPCVRL
jgi:tRNA(fMet)-specific endonuclease VapC